MGLNPIQIGFFKSLKLTLYLVNRRFFYEMNLPQAVYSTKSGLQDHLKFLVNMFTFLVVSLQCLAFATVLHRTRRKRYRKLRISTETRFRGYIQERSMKNRVFAHSKFNNTNNAGFVSRDIAGTINRGSATAEKIATVLTKMHELSKISVLNRIDNTVIETFKEHLKTPGLQAHTAQGYISALNDIISYINLRTDKNLSPVSAQKDLAIENKIVYGGKETSQTQYDKVYANLPEKQQIKLELQRNFGLRMRESHCLKQDTVKQALTSGILNLTGKDGTKNSRPRDVIIRTENQRSVLSRTLSYMINTKQHSLVENNKTFRQAKASYYREIRQAGGIKSEHNFSHGNRHFFLNQLYNSLRQEGLSKQEASAIVSSEAGHGEDRTIEIYIGKK